jgi:hypothetical protein
MDKDGNSYRFGHRIYPSRDGPMVIRYRDTDEPVPRGSGVRPCPRCGELPTPEGHDPCIANLPGVRAACCGHGVEAGYVAFNTGHVIRGEFDRGQFPRR